MSGWRSLTRVCRKDGVVVPIGEFMPSDGSGSLLYNEFIVYRQEQVKLRYLVNLDFLYEDEDEA
jgi:poly [ADP-ribose] polymerase